jgi:hypothetical protein
MKKLKIGYVRPLAGGLDARGLSADEVMGKATAEANLEPARRRRGPRSGRDGRTEIVGR